MAGQETDDFYKDAVNYWSNIPDTIDGMLGGFARLSSTDVGQSKTFLKKLIQVGYIALFLMKVNFLLRFEGG